MPDADPIYLDHNATTPLLPEVVDAMLPYLRAHFGNPSSGHIYGARAQRGVDEARGHVAALLGCDADEIVFTSGGTEANNLAILGVMQPGVMQPGVMQPGVMQTAGRATPPRRALLTSVIEHPATEQPCRWLEQQGARVTRLAVDAEGRVDTDAAAAALDEHTALITVMHANNETGVLQPISQLAALAHEHGALLHTDAAQSLGKVPVAVRELDVDLLSIAGHKLYAPKGVGALYVRRGVSLAPFTRGAGHERGLRPGTENVASIVGLGVACQAILRDLHEASARMQRLRERLWSRLAEQVPGLALNGHPELRLPNTLNVRFPSAAGDAVLAGAPDIAASTGSACHAGHTSASAVILAMGVSEEQALGSVRLSLGRHTTQDQVDRAADALARAWRRC